VFHWRSFSDRYRRGEDLQVIHPGLPGHDQANYAFGRMGNPFGEERGHGFSANGHAGRLGPDGDEQVMP
jgi:hypothetical protein